MTKAKTKTKTKAKATRGKTGHPGTGRGGARPGSGPKPKYGALGAMDSAIRLAVFEGDVEDWAYAAKLAGYGDRGRAQWMRDTLDAEYERLTRKKKSKKTPKADPRQTVIEGA